MKKTTAVLAAVLLFAAGAWADVFKFGIDADYSTVSLANINSGINEAKQGGATVSKFGSAVFGDLDLGFGVLPFLNVGPRLGVLYSFPGEIKYSDAALGISSDTTLYAGLVPLQLGAELEIGTPGMPFTVSLGIFGGYGWAIFEDADKYTAAGASTSVGATYLGGGFVGDARAAANFNIMPFMKWNINVGYRTADITDMTSQSNQTLGGSTVIKKGDKLQVNGKNTNVDFSGLNVGLGISLGF